MLHSIQLLLYVIGGLWFVLSILHWFFVIPKPFRVWAIAKRHFVLFPYLFVESLIEYVNLKK